MKLHLPPRQVGRFVALVVLAACGGREGARGAPPDSMMHPDTVPATTVPSPVASGDSRGGASGGAVPGAAADSLAFDSTARFAPTVVRMPTHGMASRVRWVLSPDRTRLIAVEDPSAIENEPVPDGWIYAAEDGTPAVLTDGVAWSVAPSPDWRRLAVGLAWRAGAGGRDSLLTAQWDSLARVSGLPARELRRTAWSASSMTYAAAVGRVAVWRLDAAGDPVRASAGGGWMLGWTSTGDLAVGMGPSRAWEDAPSTRWMHVDAVTLASRDSAPASPALAPVPWVEGPTIDISVPLDLRAARSIPIDGGTVEGRDGEIVLRAADGRRRTVGPGLLLAATRRGRVILALVPDAARRAHEPALSLTVYRVSR